MTPEETYSQGWEDAIRALLERQTVTETAIKLCESDSLDWSEAEDVEQAHYREQARIVLAAGAELLFDKDRISESAIKALRDQG